VFSVSFLREGEALSDESDPATYSIHHIFPSMTEERGTGKITNVPLLAFCFIDLTEAPKKGRLLFFTEAVQNPFPWFALRRHFRAPVVVCGPGY
jgi:hypothetical protein